MALPVYATTTDLTDGDWLDAGDVPGDAAALLRRASRRIRRLTRTAIYSVDAEGAPTDQDVANTMRDATCALVAYWVDTGDPTGASAAYSSMGIGTASLTRRDDQDPDSARDAPEAVEILADAGLARPPIVR